MTTAEELTGGAEEEVVEEPDYFNVEKSVFEFLNQVPSDNKIEVEGEFSYMRPMRAIIEFLDNPHGSVKLHQGETCIVGAFYGPSDVRIAKEIPHRAAVDVFYRPKVTGSSKAAQEIGLDPQVQERAMENTIASILEAGIYLQDDPGAGFNFILQEFENDGCLLSACLNAAVVAALDGSCSLRSSLAAVTVAVSSDIIIVDPSVSQLKDDYSALITFVFSNDNHILYTHSEGRVKTDLLATALKYARLAALEIFAFHASIVKRKYSK